MLQLLKELLEKSLKMIIFANDIFAVFDVVVNAPVAVVHAYLLRLCSSYFAPFRAFTSLVYKKQVNYLPYFVQIFLKLAVLAVFQNFPNIFFFHPSESVRTMSDELSRIVAVLRHYDLVRIAQVVRVPKTFISHEEEKCLTIPT